MIYPIKTLSRFPLILKGFRKKKGMTQSAMAERLGITQQSYAHFEAHPEKRHKCRQSVQFPGEPQRATPCA